MRYANWLGWSNMLCNSSWNLRESSAPWPLQSSKIWVSTAVWKCGFFSHVIYLTFSPFWSLLSTVLSFTSSIQRESLCKTDTLALQIKYTIAPKLVVSLLSRTAQFTVFAPNSSFVANISVYWRLQPLVLKNQSTQAPNALTSLVPYNVYASGKGLA